MHIVGKYKENKTKLHGQRPANYFAHAWGALQTETGKYEEDILGEIYMAKISHGQHGQYFTPTHVTDMMAKVVGATGQTVNDPCCGSGRMLISCHKLNKTAFHTGVDLDATCVKMAAINMWLFDMNADIYQGNALTMKMSRVWKIRKGGFIYHEPVEEMPEPQKSKMQETIFDLDGYKKAA
jgi:type I restriction-modification system DNA methylase subunit